jgi:hypothetical protein
MYCAAPTDVPTCYLPVGCEEWYTHPVKARVADLRRIGTRVDVTNGKMQWAVSQRSTAKVHLQHRRSLNRLSRCLPSS